MQKNIIAAVADNGAIGRDNELLWHISADMKYFRRTTMGCPVIMGYRTWLSIGRPLPGRKNIVITKSRFEAPEAVAQVPDAAAAIAVAEEALVNVNVNADAQNGEGQCFILGGAKTYERMMSQADKLFPDIDPSVWNKDSETPAETDPENGLQYSFAVYSRK